MNITIESTEQHQSSMPSFLSFKQLFQKNFEKVINQQSHLFLVDVSKDQLWDTYLEGFPEAGGIRQSFNCNSCRQFIKNYGNLVTINEGGIKSIWSFEAKDPIYQQVIDGLDQLVLSAQIKDVFVTTTSKLGHDSNMNLNSLIRWHHFFYDIPSRFVLRGSCSEESVKGEHRSQKQVFQRSLEELSIEAVEATLELIDQDSLYRGQEYKGMLITFLKLQKEYAATPAIAKDLFCWKQSIENSGSIAKIRNTAIGTLLIDLSNDVELDIAITKFEKVMAPANYKRPKAIFTKRMVEEAEQTIQDLGLTKSLSRRFAVVDDVTIGNLLFTDRTPLKSTTSVFDDLKNDVSVNPKKLTRVQEVTLTEFIENVVPHSHTIEFLLENKHKPNLVSLIAPTDIDAPSLFKWDNGFSWSYTGSLADSMKEKVKNAGGSVEGELRISLEWFNYDDLDLHVVEPSGEEIYYSNKRSNTSGCLDVDMNAGSGQTRTPVENIIYPFNNPRMAEGLYFVYVDQYQKRENTDVGFSVEIECQGELFSFGCDKPVVGRVLVAEFDYSKTDGITFKSSIQSSVASREIWGLSTNKFHKVNALMFSPNHWDNSSGIGNKHVFFMLEQCENTDPLVRGFFNEMLREDLGTKHKRVFEALAGKLKVDSQPHDRQLSGVGFSTTQRNSFFVKVTGNFERTIKVNV